MIGATGDKPRHDDAYEAAEDAFTSEGGGSVASVASVARHRPQVSTDHDARRDGLRRRYRGYRYDVLSDAVAYAALLRLRG
jgi:hypothetical protein